MVTPAKKNKKQEVKEFTTTRKFEFQANSVHQKRMEQYKRLYQ
jgi:hypothetical protein